MRRRTGVPAVLREHALDPRSRKRRCTESVQHARVERSIQTFGHSDIQTETETDRDRQIQSETESETD